MPPVIDVRITILNSFYENIQVYFNCILASFIGTIFRFIVVLLMLGSTATLQFKPLGVGVREIVGLVGLVGLVRLGPGGLDPLILVLGGFVAGATWALGTGEDTERARVSGMGVLLGLAL